MKISRLLLGAASLCAFSMTHAAELEIKVQNLTHGTCNAVVELYKELPAAFFKVVVAFPVFSKRPVAPLCPLFLGSA